MDTVDDILRQEIATVLRGFRPALRWNRAKDWHLDEPIREKLVERLAGGVATSRRLQIVAVEPTPAPAHSCPGGKMPD